MTKKTFADLKKASKNSEVKFSKATEQTVTSKKIYEDDNKDFWYPSVDKAGNGGATIRFVPQTDDDKNDWERMFQHGFKSTITGQWYIENCPTTLGKECPMCKVNSELWNSDVKENKDIASKQKRKLNFITNVYIVEDKLNPENVGKVKLFRFGPAIMEMIQNQQFPPVEGDEKSNPFDLLKGKNLKLVIFTDKKSGFRKYDHSRFESPGPLFDSEEETTEVWNSVLPLDVLVSPDKFKSFEALQARVNRVMALDTPMNTARKNSKAAVNDAPWEDDNDMPKEQAPRLKAAASKKRVVVEDDDDDTIEIFKKLKKSAEYDE